jgi:predicted GNAT family acetyltransferase
MPIIVAQNDGRLLGYLISSALSAHARSPIIQAMLRTYAGSPRAYNHDPICVEESERGRGLASAMFKALQAQLPGRECITFIRRDNPSSTKAHCKMGMREVAEFMQENVAYVVMSHVA